MIAPAYMDNERIGELIRANASEMVEDDKGYWKFEFEGCLVFVITDENHNRMRIMSPIVEASEIENSEWEVLMSANFDRALDARYCLNNDCLWSAFIHPLHELSSNQFMDALRQVATLAKNYGSSYSSGNLVFGGE